VAAHSDQPREILTYFKGAVSPTRTIVVAGLCTTIRKFIMQAAVINAEIRNFNDRAFPALTAPMLFAGPQPF
jgi:hypothetical protein